jgi:hypothetical protein
MEDKQNEVVLRWVNNQALVAKLAQRQRCAYTTSENAQHPKKHMLEAK